MSVADSARSGYSAAPYHQVAGLAGISDVPHRYHLLAQGFAEDTSVPGSGANKSARDEASGLVTCEAFLSR